MKKIPTLLMRNPKQRSKVTDEVNPVCAWVLAGEGVATRKFDGTCVKLDEVGDWWARREIKPGQTAPVEFVPEDADEVTGKVQGWLPMEMSSFAKFFEEVDPKPKKPGTYELIGPKVNGNPENMATHQLIFHGASVYQNFNGPRTVEEIKEFVTLVGGKYGVEGVVWHHPDGRRAKLKFRDL